MPKQALIIGVSSQDGSYLADLLLEKGYGVTGTIRRTTTFAKDSDFDTGNYKHKASMRFVPGWADWRGLYGSQGA